MENVAGARPRAGPTIFVQVRGASEHSHFWIRETL